MCASSPTTEPSTYLGLWCLSLNLRWSYVARMNLHGILAHAESNQRSRVAHLKVGIASFVSYNNPSFLTLDHMSCYDVSRPITVLRVYWSNHCLTHSMHGILNENVSSMFIPLGDTGANSPMISFQGRSIHTLKLPSRFREKIRHKSNHAPTPQNGLLVFRDISHGSPLFLDLYYPATLATCIAYSQVMALITALSLYPYASTMSSLEGRWPPQLVLEHFLSSPMVEPGKWNSGIPLAGFLAIALGESSPSLDVSLGSQPFPIPFYCHYSHLSFVYKHSQKKKPLKSPSAPFIYPRVCFFVAFKTFSLF
ncbi:hypothetical protein VNO77_27098 [Canavalia gladiata]|uniref:Uncharacterized protein n=1 Tax=Canavalia gladiata TaxID=3824 RepID=A0AAN9KWB6_CANGL